MTSYVKITDYAAKDALLTGNPSKLVKGTELGAEFDLIAAADADSLKSADIGVSVQAYDADIPVVSASQGEMEAGTEAALRSMSPLRIAQAIASLAPSKAQDFRLSLTSGLPVTTDDVTGATTIYSCPKIGNQISLYTGSQWVTRTSAEFSLALGTLTSGKPYDVFCYDNAGTPTLEFLVWTNDTTRATALSYQDGVLVKSGAATRRYLGTFYTTAATTTEDSANKRYLFNYYNQVRRKLLRIDSTASWTYTTNTIRQANASTSNQVEFVIGVSDHEVCCSLRASAYNTTGNASVSAGIGFDATNTYAANSLPSSVALLGSGKPIGLSAEYRDTPSAGRHYLSWCEASEATGTTTWLGTDSTYKQTAGLIGTVMA